jgi:hypothetical protein
VSKGYNNPEQADFYYEDALRSTYNAVSTIAMNGKNKNQLVFSFDLVTYNLEKHQLEPDPFREVILSRLVELRKDHDEEDSFDIVIKHKNGPIIAHAIISADLTSGRLDSGALSAEIEHGNIHVFDNALSNFIDFNNSSGR